MISDFCWRRSSQELQPIPDGLCFCDIQQQPISQGSERSPAVIREVVATLGLNHVTPPADRYIVHVDYNDCCVLAFLCVTW